MQAQAKPGPSQQEEQPLDDDSKVMPWEKEKSDEEGEEKSTADSEEETWEGQPPAYDSEDEDQAALEQEYFEEEFELEIPGKASPPSPARKYGQGGIPPGEYYRVVKGEPVAACVLPNPGYGGGGDRQMLTGSTHFTTRARQLSPDAVMPGLAPPPLC